MLSIEKALKIFPVVKKTDRDVEIPEVIEFVKRLAPVESLLDVGSHFSTYNEYAHKLRPLVKRYDGVDIIADSEATKILDNFYVGNANDFNFPIKQYDVVLCISTIEHSGVSTYKVVDIQEEQNKLFMKCLELTKKYMWISFPTGLPYVYPNELSIITEKQLKRWETLTNNFKVKERFFHNQAGPQWGSPWIEHDKREAACLQQYWDYCGNQAITVLEIDKM